MKRVLLTLTCSISFGAVPACLAQGQSNFQNPGVSTTPGIGQPTTPSFGAVNTVNTARTLPAGVGTTGGTTTTPQTPLGFSSINTATPVVYPSKFGTSTVLSTQSPQAQSVVSPQVSTAQNSINTPQQLYTAPPGFLSPSPQFVPIQSPRPFSPPSTNGFVAK